VQNNNFNGFFEAVGGNVTGLVQNNYFEDNEYAFGPTSIKDTLVFKNNTIYRHHVSPTIIIEDWLPDTSKFIIRNNLFYNGYNQSRIIDGFGVPNTDSIFIHNNLFFRKYIPTGIYPHFGLANDFVLFYNNTIDGTSYLSLSTVTGILTFYQDSTRTINNNIISRCELAVHNNGLTARSRYNDFFQNEDDGDVIIEDGNVFADPMFEDTIGFYLQAYSPCIDAGDPEILDPDDSRSDIGAYGGPYGEYYEYQDLAPRVPDSLEAFVPETYDTIYVSWLYNTEADFNRYYLHRDTIDGFEPSFANLIAEPDTSVYIDTDIDLQHSYYYRIAAVDNQDNISDYSNQLGVVFTGFDDFDPNMPRSVVLYQNYPNPFNNRTIIRFYLPDVGCQPAEVQLDIYDVLGKRVKRLIDERLYPGEHKVTWDGTSNAGDELASGMYFYRLFISKAELTKPKKLMLIR
jgi:hypothetical protein